MIAGAGYLRWGSAANHPLWNGGRYVSAGYVFIYAPGHPRATASRKHYVREHILIVERALGHYLDEKHPVHHVDENGQNNANSNLVACEDQSYHLLLHRRLRAYLACGDANARRCKYCGQYDARDNLAVYETSRPGSLEIYHRDCFNARRRRREALIKARRDELLAASRQHHRQRP